MKERLLFKAEVGETQELLFQRMIEYSKEFCIDVYGVFNGVLYVQFYGQPNPMEY